MTMNNNPRKWHTSICHSGRQSGKNMSTTSTKSRTITQVLCDENIVTSFAEARRLIISGRVTIDDEIVINPLQVVDEDESHVLNTGNQYRLLRSNLSGKRAFQQSLWETTW